jgi:hypothetical protein
MGDVLIEDLFKRNITGKEIGIRALCIFLGTFAFIIMLMLSFFLFPIVVLVFYLLYLLWQTTNLEYEYSYLNGELTIDKIKSKSKRKRLAVYDLKGTEILAPMDNDELRSYLHKVPVKDFSSAYDGDEKMAAVVNGNYGSEVIILKKNTKIIESVRSYRPIVVKFPYEQV